jgi:hypothetical protein
MHSRNGSSQKYEQESALIGVMILVSLRIIGVYRRINHDSHLHLRNCMREFGAYSHQIQCRNIYHTYTSGSGLLVDEYIRKKIFRGRDLS